MIEATAPTPKVVLEPCLDHQQWAGVVSIDRPDFSRIALNPFEDPKVRVASARAIEFNGLRAVLVYMPWSAVKQLFQSDDEDQIFVEATVRGGHLQLHGRADFREWAHYSARHN